MVTAVSPQNVWHFSVPVRQGVFAPDNVPDAPIANRRAIENPVAIPPSAKRGFEPALVQPFPPDPAAGEADNAAQDEAFLRMMTAIMSMNSQGHQDMIASIDQYARLNRTELSNQMEALSHAAQAKSTEHSASEAGFWLGLIGDIAMIAAGIAMTIATGGAAAPVLALAIANMLFSAWDSIAKVVKRYTGEDLSFSAGLTALSKKMGADDETASKIGTWGDVGTKLTLALGNMGAIWKSSLKHGIALGQRFANGAQAAGTASQMGHAGTRIAEGVATNEKHAAGLEAIGAKSRSILLKTYTDRALKLLDEQFTIQRETMNQVRRDLDTLHESHLVPFRHFA